MLFGCFIYSFTLQINFFFQHQQGGHGVYLVFSSVRLAWDAVPIIHISSGDNAGQLGGIIEQIVE